MSNKTLDIAGAWSGNVYITLMGLAWVILANFVPPYSPAMSANEIAEVYRDHSLRISICAMIMLFASFALIPYSAVLTRLMKKVEGYTGVLTMSTCFSLITAMLINSLSAVIWGTAAFRPERAPEITQMLNDLGWLFYMGMAPPIFVAWGGIAYAALARNHATNNVFPRWYGYLNLWLVIAIIPGCLAFVFKSGPFAWNGLIVFWLAFIVFSLIYLVAPIALIPAIKKHL